MRELQRQFAPQAGLDELRELARRMPLKKMRPGDALFKQDDPGDTLYLLRSGNLTLTRKSDGGPVVVAQLRSGELAGELAVMSDGLRHEDRGGYGRNGTDRDRPRRVRGAHEAARLAHRVAAERRRPSAWWTSPACRRRRTPARW